MRSTRVARATHVQSVSDALPVPRSTAVTLALSQVIACDKNEDIMAIYSPIPGVEASILVRVLGRVVNVRHQAASIDDGVGDIDVRIDGCCEGSGLSLEGVVCLEGVVYSAERADIVQLVRVASEERRVDTYLDSVGSHVHRCEADHAEDTNNRIVAEIVDAADWSNVSESSLRLQQFIVGVCCSGSDLQVSVSLGDRSCGGGGGFGSGEPYPPGERGVVVDAPSSQPLGLGFADRGHEFMQWLDAVKASCGLLGGHRVLGGVHRDCRVGARRGPDGIRGVVGAYRCREREHRSNSEEDSGPPMRMSSGLGVRASVLDHRLVLPVRGRQPPGGQQQLPYQYAYQARATRGARFGATLRHPGANFVAPSGTGRHHRRGWKSVARIAMFQEMEPAPWPLPDRRLLELACGRILGASRSMSRAYDFDVAPGPHREPWTMAYLREAVALYAEALPASYQSDIESLFRHCAELMGQGKIPAELAEDWAIIRQYLANAADSISERLAATGSPHSGEASLHADIDTNDEPPPVVRFDRLAALTTPSGAQRLHAAASAVQSHVAGDPGVELDAAQRSLLEGVSAGLTVSELATQLGYSRRSIFRELSRLWDTMGVPDRAQGLRKAEAQGLVEGRHG